MINMDIKKGTLTGRIGWNVLYFLCCAVDDTMTQDHLHGSKHVGTVTIYSFHEGIHIALDLCYRHYVRVA